MIIMLAEEIKKVLDLIPPDVDVTEITIQGNKVIYRAERTEDSKEKNVIKVVKTEYFVNYPLILKKD